MKGMSLEKFGWVILSCLLLSFACNGKVTTRPNQTNYQFTINGVMVKDVSLGKDIIYFKVLRDSLNFDSALVKVGTDTVKNYGNGTYIKQAPKLFDYGQNITILISVVKDSFSLSTSVLMPGSFKITGTNHPDVHSNQTEDVKLYFSLSSNSSGYFMSILQPGDVDGYTGLVPADQIGNARILPETFYNGFNNFVTGKYKVYLVAYRSSFLEYPDMNLFLPGSLPANNISGANGTIGAGVVVYYDSLRAE